VAEGRMLKRNVSNSRRLAELKTDSARLLWTWIIPYLDVEGRFYANPDIIKGQIVPRLKTFTEAKITGYLQDMARVGLIIIYEVDGDQYLQFRKFDDFQHLRKDREGKPLPGPENAGVLHDNSNTTPGEVRPKLREVKLREVNTIAWSDEARAFIGIQAEDRKLWSEAYPALNLDQEIAKAAAWVIANPKNKKSNWPRFLNNWLKASQDRAPAKGSEKPFLQAPKPKQPAMKCDKCENYFEETVEYRSQQLCPGCMKKVNPEVDPKIKDMLRVIGKPLNDHREVPMENKNEKGKKPVTYEEKTGMTSAGEKFVEVVSKRPKSPEQKEKGEGDGQ